MKTCCVKDKNNNKILELKSLQNVKMVETVLILYLKVLYVTCWRFIKQRTENKNPCTSGNAFQSLWELKEV